MSTALRNITKVHRDRVALTHEEVYELVDKLKIDDTPSTVTKAISPVALQLFIHTTMNSRKLADGAMVNDYTGVVCDGLGLYPTRRDHPMMHPDGRFRMHGDHGLMYSAYIHADGGERIAFISGDIFRSTENRFLASQHLMWHVIHNKRMDYHGGDYDKAREDTLAMLCLYFLDVFLDDLEMDRDELFRDVAMTGATNTLEAHTAIARWLHAGVPSHIASTHIFEPISPADINLADLLVAPARHLNYGVSTAMSQMMHLEKPRHIAHRTADQHLENRQCDWGDILSAMSGKVKTTADIAPETPIWFAMLMEAEQAGNGRLGPIGRRLVADIAAFSLSARRGQGLWHTPKDAPSTVAGMLEYGQFNQSLLDSE
jgi:hypothetical protein